MMNKMMEYKGYHAQVEYDADDGFLSERSMAFPIRCSFTGLL